MSAAVANDDEPKCVPSPALAFFFSYAANVASLREGAIPDGCNLLQVSLDAAILAARLGVLPNVSDSDKRRIVPMIGRAFDRFAGRHFTTCDVVTGLRALADEAERGSK